MVFLFAANLISSTAKPVILDAESTKSVTFAVGKSETKDVKCVATGIPVPTIKITKGNSTLTGTDTISGNKITSVLKFSANAPSDAGVITCTANNSVGAASYEIKITLIGMMTLFIVNIFRQLYLQFYFEKLFTDIILKTT